MLTAALDVAGIVIVAALLPWLQRNINQYWLSLPNVSITSARIGKGEIILAIIGIGLWILTIGNLFSDSWRSLT